MVHATRLYPHAVVYKSVDMGLGPFRPVGITVHYTAGSSALSTIDYMRQQTKLAYHLLIERDGSVIQMSYLDQRVNHAGVADWNGHSPNREHVAVALASWGLLEKDGDRFLTYTGHEISPALVAYRNGHHWEAATPEQITSLEKTCVWLCKYLAISPKEICGHDECAPKRKVDPGGVLPYLMSKFRFELNEEIAL